MIQADSALSIAEPRCVDDLLIASAEEMWSLWINFFDRLRKVMFGTEELPAAEPAEAMATA